MAGPDRSPDLDEGRLTAAIERAAAFAGAPVVAAYLFGSHSERRAHRESGIDLAVLLDRERAASDGDRFEFRVRLTSALIAELRTNAVDLVVLNDAPPGLASRIVTRGRRIFCSDPAAEHAFRRDVQLRAADLEPFLRRARAVKLRAMAPWAEANVERCPRSDCG
ncbi:MAG TPA: nucleotidyltransferase domain-containing protein [Candidatus Binatia bacterium]|nr:nucleotidyltransferase domain-containing protein [Candidatus Binatia bacterium]